MDDLVSWLRAQLDDDERVAREAAGEGPHSSTHWAIDREFHPPTPYIRQLGIYASPSQAPGHVDPEQCEHIACWDPARVLAEIDAKRRIMDGLDIDINGEASPWRGCGDDCEFKAIYWAVQVLALPYADRAGYDESWRP